MIRTKRVYEVPVPQDGQRILVDRIWPRGVSRDEAELEAWMKEVAPSDELRRWFDHDPGKWDGLRRRYFAELDEKPEPVDELLERSDGRLVTLLYGARDRDHNQAVALKDYLEGRGDRE